MVYPFQEYPSLWSGVPLAQPFVHILPRIPSCFPSLLPLWVSKHKLQLIITRRAPRVIRVGFNFQGGFPRINL